MKLKDNRNNFNIKNNNNTPIAENFLKKFEILDRKISYIRQDLTSYDLLKITQIVDNPEDFISKSLQLLPNNSLIINCETFSSNGQTYSKGDILVKKNDGSTELILSQSGGIYFPYKLTKLPEGKGYRIEYKYSQIQPNTGTTSEVDINSGQSAVLASNISFNGFNDSYQGTVYYVNELNVNFTPESDNKKSITFSIEYHDQEKTKPIEPVIVFFTKENEIIYCDYNLKDIGNRLYKLIFPSIVYKVVVK